MAAVDDGRTLLVAESWGSRLTAYAIGADGQLTDRRVWAETPGLHPDGIDPQPDGTVWLADVGTRCCVRVAEGGEILDRVQLPQSAFDCVVGDLGGGPTLYVAVNETSAAIPRPARPGRSWQCSWGSLSPPRPDRSTTRTRRPSPATPCSAAHPAVTGRPSRS